VAVIILLVIALRSLLFIVPAYLVFWKFRKDRFQHRRIQERFPVLARIRYEFKWTMSTFAIYTVLSVGAYLLYVAGYTRRYAEVSEYGWTYFFFSILVMIVLHDAYFYWTHRLLHWKPLFRRVHRVHHQSFNPSPWAAFSFHPVEAVISFGILPLILVLIPFHEVALKLFLVYMTIMNVWGHVGYEFFPRGFTRHRLAKWHNTSTHHNMHHSRVHCNYSLYFNLWDRLMGTNHADYDGTFEEVVSRPSPRFTESAGAGDRESAA
jgi:sterol desaturase/sphingolipid hydroxylase (fatty acid hydroxylase superfamily)